MILEKTIIKELIKELKNQNIIRNGSTAKENTEILLKKFHKLKKSIVKIDNQIIALEKENTKNNLKIKTNRVALRDKNMTYIYTDETLESRINELKQLKIRTQNYIDYVNSVLKEFEEDEYYPIIEEMYLNDNRKTQKQIAEFYNWSEGTVAKHKDSLLEDISTMLFPDLFIKDINS